MGQTAFCIKKALAVQINKMFKNMVDSKCQVLDKIRHVIFHSCKIF